MDKYSLNARLYPIIILFIPILILGLFYSFAFKNYMHTMISFGITAALSYFFSNLGRDMGKKKELNLWKEWGGMPSVQLFSFQNNIIDYYTKVNYHNILMELAPPSNENINFEKAEIEDVEEIYRSWTRYLISKTRDYKNFPLLFNENISYGFRRNLWGLKKPSLIIISFSMFANFAFQWSKFTFYYNLYQTEFFLSESILLGILLFWIFIINSNWVKIPAFAYAERLLESIGKMKEMPSISNK